MSQVHGMNLFLDIPVKLQWMAPNFKHIFLCFHCFFNTRNATVTGSLNRGTKSCYSGSAVCSCLLVALV